MWSFLYLPGLENDLLELLELCSMMATNAVDQLKLEDRRTCLYGAGGLLGLCPSVLGAARCPVSMFFFITAIIAGTY